MLNLKAKRQHMTPCQIHQCQHFRGSCRSWEKFQRISGKTQDIRNLIPRCWDPVDKDWYDIVEKDMSAVNDVAEEASCVYDCDIL